jgi:hypothetical protein
MPNKIEIRGVVLARSIQVIRSSTGTVGYLPDIIQTLKGKYGFLTAPKDADIGDASKGAEFTHGRVIREDQLVIIDKLTVFNDGVVAETKSSTDDADLFLEDLIEWAKTALPKALPTGPRYYLSHLEIKMESPLEIYAPGFRPIGEKLTEMLASYGIKTPPYEVTNVGLYFDLLGRVAPQPGAFYIDRRQNVRYEEGVWFSQAPLRTTDHIALLKEMER